MLKQREEELEVQMQELIRENEILQSSSSSPASDSLWQFERFTFLREVARRVALTEGIRVFQRTARQTSVVSSTSSAMLMIQKPVL